MYNYVLIRDRKTTLNTFEKSDREVLLMLRGLARSYKGWLGAEEDLSEKFDVICIDLPGVGLSKNEKLLYKVEDMAEKIFEVLKSLDINSLYILAPSLGSIVSYELIKKLTKDVVKGVVLVVPSHSGIGVNRLSPLAARTLSSTPFVSKDVRIAMLRNMLIGKNSAGENIIDSDLALEKR
ncbi:MAG: alpha/beta fold hydrolase, partial [Candidatus Sericytochromatia bacterium]